MPKFAGGNISLSAKFAGAGGVWGWEVTFLEEEEERSIIYEHLLAFAMSSLYTK